MTPTKISLGHKVECKVTGFVGIAVSRIDYLNGCIQYNVKPKVNKHGEDQKSRWIDEQQLLVIGRGVSPDPKPAGGGFREHP